MAQTSEKERYILVRERLEHVELVFELRHHYFNHDLVKDIGENGWTHPWIYFDALMYYLLLTCFDLLGQPSEYRTFSEWLEARKTESEREAALRRLPVDADAVAIAKHLNSEYQQLYGVKNSFHRFVLHVLNEDERAELYASIDITRARKGGNPNTLYPALGTIDSEKEKLSFLFSLRNKFTHSAIAMGSPAAGIFKDPYAPVFINGVPMMGYSIIHQEDKGDEYWQYGVRDWPRLLQRLIWRVVVTRESELLNQHGQSQS